MRPRPFLVAALATAMSLLVMSPVRANADEVTVTFFHSANADARWVHFTPAPPGDPDTWSIRLQLDSVPSCLQPNYVNCPYAGARLNGVAGTPPPNPPSYDFYSDTGGSSGGSPRLVMVFSDNGDMELRPLDWTANTWTHLDGNTPFWDVNGGTCGFLYAATYSAGLACHAGKTVTDVFVVTDAAWQLTSPQYIHYIDNISYGSAFITSPEQAGCHEGDGNGHFRGDHGDGNVDSDSDGCIDGDKDHVDSDNRGDGKDFHSTSIDSVALNSLGDTLTITGTGTSAGTAVSFVLVEVESTPLTPGWVSLTFSDGYANAGDLLDGSVVLY